MHRPPEGGFWIILILDFRFWILDWSLETPILIHAVPHSQFFFHPKVSEYPEFFAKICFLEST
jgi:hypothetical protein